MEKSKNNFKPKKICMLASGGDAPGMNACMEAIFNYATKLDWEVYASIYGYDGLIDNNVVKVTHEKCSNISHMAGCVYKCGRSKRMLDLKFKALAVDNFKQHGFDSLIIIGGNGSLMGGEILSKEFGINVVCIPATVDNDCYYTNNALGFSSAVEGIVRYIDQVKPTMRAHNRNFMLEVMGKGCSQLAMTAGIAGFANLIDRSERRCTPNQIADKFNEQKSHGNESVMAIVEEHRSDADNLQKNVGDIAGHEVRFERGYYYQRGVTPTAHDRLLAAYYGITAVDLIAQNKFGVAIGMTNGQIITPTLSQANSAKPIFNEQSYSIIDKIANR